MFKTWDPEKNMMVEHGKYITNQAIQLRDIIHPKLDFSGFIKLKDNKTKNNFWKDYGCASKAELARRVCGFLMRTIVEDLIETNNVYCFPIQYYSFMRIVRQSPQTEQYLMRRRSWGTGAYKDVDPFACNGALYIMVMEIKRYGKFKQQIVKLSHPHYKKIIKKANKGMVYFDNYAR